MKNSKPKDDGVNGDEQSRGDKQLEEYAQTHPDEHAQEVPEEQTEEQAAEQMRQEGNPTHPDRSRP